MSLETMLSVVAWCLGVVGALIVFLGGLVGYIYQSHVRDNDRRFQENREDHIRIHGRLDDIND